MADFSLSITVPDAKVTEFTEALRSYFGKKPDGSDYSLAELKALVQAETVRWLKARHKDHLLKTQSLDVADIT